MAEAVTSLNPTGQVESFVKKLFGPHKGYMYCPVTSPGDASEWQPYFFKYPEELDKIAEHVIEKRSEKDVYFSPTLFYKPDLRRENIYGTKYLWVEFNGELPESDKLKSIPSPGMKVRTSVVGHDVWFWEMEYFSKDMERVEDVLKRLAFHLDGDLSNWHFESVLRFPGTIHHRSKLSTQLYEKGDTYSPIGTFEKLPEAPKYLSEDVLVSIPPKEEVYFKYAFPIELSKMIRKADPLAGKEEEDKTRKTLHSAYLKVGFELAELGLEDREMLSVLLDIDRRWKLWSDRTKEAQRGRLLGLIQFIRKKKPYSLPPVIDDLSSIYYSWDEFENTEFQFNWLVENLLEEAGLGIIVADSETGKTRLTISMAIHLAIGRNFLIWKAERPIRVMFASLEQTGPALKRTFSTLSLDLLKLTDDERKLLNENFSVLAMGSSLHLDKKKYQDRFTEFVSEHKPDLIVIDTLGVAVQDDIENAKIVNGVFEYINSKIRKEIGAAVLFIHHNKKHGNKKADKDDMFGSVYIRNQISMSITLHRLLPKTMMKLSVENSKNRLSIPFSNFECIGHRDSARYDLLGPGNLPANGSIGNEKDDNGYAVMDFEDEDLDI